MSLRDIIRIPEFLEKDDPLCAQTDPEMFFARPLNGETGRNVYPNERQAKAVCRECPLIKDCLAYALRYDESGIWGGTNETERAKIRRTTGIRATNRRSNDYYLKLIK